MLKCDKNGFEKSNIYFGYFADQSLCKLLDRGKNNHNLKHINCVLAGLVESWSLSEGRDVK